MSRDVGIGQAAEVPLGPLATVGSAGNIAENCNCFRFPGFLLRGGAQSSRPSQQGGEQN